MGQRKYDPDLRKALKLVVRRTSLNEELEKVDLVTTREKYPLTLCPRVLYSGCSAILIHLIGLI